MIRYEIDLKGAFVKGAVSAPLFLFTSGVAWNKHTKKHKKHNNNNNNNNNKNKNDHQEE